MPPSTRGGALGPAGGPGSCPHVGQGRGEPLQLASERETALASHYGESGSSGERFPCEPLWKLALPPFSFPSQFLRFGSNLGNA